METVAYLPLSFHMFYTTTNDRQFQYSIVTSPDAYRSSPPVQLL